MGIPGEMHVFILGIRLEPGRHGLDTNGQVAAVSRATGS